MMDIAAQTRLMLIQTGTTVTVTPQGGDAVHDVPVVITEQSGQSDQMAGRSQRTAQIRVSKADVAAISHRMTFAEADGTVWTVPDTNRVINDRSAGTWRVMCTTHERGKF